MPGGPGALRQCLQELSWALREDKQQRLEEEWTLEKTKMTLHSFNNSKTPGVDSLPKELYVAFWDQMGPDLLEVFWE